MSEFYLHRYVVDLLRFTAKRGVLYYHCPNGEYRSRRTGARLKAMGVMPGVADICLVIPPSGAHFLELKTAKGRSSPEQRVFANLAAAAGARYAVARSPDEARTLLEAWGAGSGCRCRSRHPEGRMRFTQSPSKEGDGA